MSYYRTRYASKRGNKRKKCCNEEANEKSFKFASVNSMLATGLLEGVPVSYVSMKYNIDLHGFIKGDGYQCGCSSCDYDKVVCALDFERHAGANTNYPNNHIFLENGRSVHEVFKILTQVPPKSLYKEMIKVTGHQIKSELYEPWRKGVPQTMSPKQDRVDRNTTHDGPPNLLSQLQPIFRTELKRPCKKPRLKASNTTPGLGMLNGSRIELPPTFNAQANVTWPSQNQKHDTNEVSVVFPLEISDISHLASNRREETIPYVDASSIQQLQDQEHGINESARQEVEKIISMDSKDLSTLTTKEKTEAKLGNLESELQALQDESRIIEQLEKKEHDSTSSPDQDTGRIGESLPSKDLSTSTPNPNIKAKFDYLESELAASQDDTITILQLEHQELHTACCPDQESEKIGESMLNKDSYTLTSNEKFDSFEYELPAFQDDTTAILQLQNKEHATTCCPNQEMEGEFVRNSLRAVPSEGKEIKSYNKGSSTSHIYDVKSLLATGLLEGMLVTYKFKKDNIQLRGFIKDLGYLCGCSSCNYKRVLSALKFEEHAKASTSNQNDHIFLENGMSMYALVKELCNVPHESLCEVLEAKIGCHPNLDCYNARRACNSEAFRATSQEIQGPSMNSEKNNQNHLTDHFEPQPTSRKIKLSSCAPTTQGSIDSATSSSKHSSHNNSQVPTVENKASLPFESAKFRTLYPSSNILSTILSAEQIYSTMRSKDTKSDPGLVTEYSDAAASGSSTESFTMTAADDSADRASSCSPLALRVKQKDFNMKRKSDNHESLSSPPENVHNSQESSFNPIEEHNISQVVEKKRDHDLHKLIFGKNGYSNGSDVAYVSNGQRVLLGKKVENGILCSCCNTEVSPSTFEVHAGFPGRRQPYRNIFTPLGFSLHQLSLILSTGQDLTAMYSEDRCTICGDEGMLIPCDRCPKAFHPACLKLGHIPEGDWFCPYCEDSSRSTTVSTITSSSPSEESEPVSLRMKRILIDLMGVHGHCTLCKAAFSCLEILGAETIRLCSQCNNEYHISCLRSTGFCDLKEFPFSKWFCCRECQMIHDVLQNMVVNGALAVHSLVNEARDDLHWQLLSAEQNTQADKIFSDAVSIFQDAFGPIVKGDEEIIPYMVCGRKIAGHDFQGMYLSVLTIGSVVVSASILKIFGKSAAEIPLIATPFGSQGKGHLQTLLSLIEMLLNRLSIEVMMLPAAKDEMPLFIDELGFTHVSTEQLKMYSEALPLIMFKNTTMLVKAISCNV